VLHAVKNQRPFHVLKKRAGLRVRPKAFMSTQTKPPTDAAATVSAGRDAAPGARAWSRAVDDPQFHDLPYKIESNAQGQLVLTAKKFYHSDFQGRVMDLLSERGPSAEGRSIPECAVQTSEGVKLPDVVWISAERAAQVPEGTETLSTIPEICVEVLSRSNTEAEMEGKRPLFFEGGAEEVWIVDAEGGVRFYDADGQIEQSTLAPDFPEQVQG
jgi:Uma2 family endonuclease